VLNPLPKKLLSTRALRAINKLVTNANPDKSFDVNSNESTLVIIAGRDLTLFIKGVKKIIKHKPTKKTNIVSFAKKLPFKVFLNMTIRDKKSPKNPTIENERMKAKMMITACF
jgi:hypothetical protein